jgi:surfeit locus 1 family protein
VIARLRAARLLAPALATVLALVVLVSLGTWQLQRKAWKERVVAAVAARALAAPVTDASWSTLACPLASPPSIDLDPCDFRPVRVTIAPPFGAERHVFVAVPRQAGGVGGPGFMVFAPVRVPAAGGDLYVNLGFVPEAMKPPLRRPAPSTSALEISGLLRRAEPRGRFSNANDAAGNVYYVRDPLEFGVIDRSGQRGPSPRHYYIDRIDPAGAGAWPRPMAGRLDLPNRHLEYALTWYGLALTLIGVFAAFAVQRLRDISGSAGATHM